VSATDSVPHLLECIARLPHRDQDLLLELVHLMALATPEAQAQARWRLSAAIATAPRSRRACIAAVSAVVDYLETSIDRQDSEWVAPLWRESILPTPD
jgi:hypothetical protein